MAPPSDTPNDASTDAPTDAPTGAPVDADAVDTLIFVYNAERGVFHALADLAHKTFAPDTYACNLCKITYSPLGMRRAWRKFLAELGLELEFLHRDECRERYGDARFTPPVILRRRRDEVSVLVDAGTLDACRSIDDLQDRLSAALR